MPASLATHLRALKPEDLETLLQRRHEVRLLLAAQSPRDFGALAQVLAQPSGIRVAAASLDRFCSQLLQVAVFLGPQVDAAALAQQAEGVPAGWLREGAEELSRWGLAFVEEKGHGSRDGARGWSLEVPACSAAAVAMPPGFGHPARRALESRSPGFLSAVARHVGLASRPRSGKGAMVAELAEALSGPQRVQELLAEAPAKASQLFEVIREAGGAMSRPELMTRGLVRWSDPPWSERRKVLTPLDWLESRGLVTFDGATSYAGHVAVPAEVELALRGGRLFATWPPAVPPPLTTGGAGAAAQAGAGDPSKILVDMEALLEEWSQTRPASLQRGGLGVRELRKTAKTLGFPERYVGFLYALAAESGLIGADGQERVVPSDMASDWAAESPPRRWEALFGTWLGCMLWTEQADGLVPIDKAQNLASVSRLRRSLVEELASLPPGAVTDVRLLGGRLAWRHPALVHCEDCAVTLAERAVEGLTWLGTAIGSPSVSLLEPGRSAATDPRWVDEAGPALTAFAAEVATCTVGADLNVIVPGPPVRELASSLARFADLRASSPARIYRLSEASLRRGLDSGMQAAEILSVLERHAPRGIPQNVAYLIEDVGRRHGHLVAGRMGLYLRSDDPALLRAATADRRLARFRPHLLAPSVAVLHGDDVEALLTALRTAGYLPIAEAIDGSSENPPPTPGVRPLIRPIETQWALSTSQAADLGEAIRQGRCPGGSAAPDSPLLDGRTLRRPGQIRKLMELAIEEGIVVEIAYRSSVGERTRRSIEPAVLDGSSVVAWCRLRDDERRFVISGIEWARVAGESYGAEAEGVLSLELR